MKGSVQLARVKGIAIKIHWTFILLIAWIVGVELMEGQGYVPIIWSVFFILVIFACVVLHELGHAITALHYGINTRQITLLPIGGIASLESMPDEPKQELLVALAGPAVNVVIALILSLLPPVRQFFGADRMVVEQALSIISGHNILFMLFSANIMLVLFNLIPAFPMDGGRVLRALLSMRMDKVTATKIAAVLGQMVAFFFFFLGLLFNPLLVLIAVFIFFGAQGESVLVQQLSLLRGHRVYEAVMTNITSLNPETTLQEVIRVILSGTERDFVVVDDGDVQGVVYQSDLIQAYRRQDDNIRVKDIMSQQFEVVDINDSLVDIYRKASMHRKSFFPVLDHHQLVGAIDLNNINEFIVFGGIKSAPGVKTGVISRGTAHV